MSRIKQLQCELSVARSQIHSLTIENRILKVVEKRHENALSKYEGTHSKLPLMIRSYSEDIRTLQARLRRVKGLHRDLETRHKLQGAELFALQKQHKHLLDLTKNKQLGEREKLSNQLERAENMVKQHEIKIQSLMKKDELLCKNHRSHINVEMAKTRQLQAQLDYVMNTNRQLELKIEKLQYQIYGGRRNRVCGTSQNVLNSSELAVQAKRSMLNSDFHDGRGDPAVPRSDTQEKTFIKPELVHGESEISDHTKELQKNLMTQIHGDVINKPDMLAVNNRSDSSDTKSWLNNGISELIKEKDLLYSDDQSDENIAQPIESTTEVYVNPFSVSNEFALNKSKKYQLSIHSSADEDALFSTDFMSPSIPQTIEETQFDSDVSSISSVSDSD